MNNKGNNLFPYIAKCGLCGAPMRFKDHGDSPKSGKKKFTCDSSGRKLKDEKGRRRCNAKSVNYDEFVDHIFNNFQELDISQFFPGDSEVISKKMEITKSNNSNRRRDQGIRKEK